MLASLLPPSVLMEVNAITICVQEWHAFVYFTLLALLLVLWNRGW
jgi:hypothetical protein